MRLAICGIALALAACHAGDTAALGTTPEGYGELRFGMTFPEALTIASADLFNPAALSDCMANMPIDGCLLSPRRDTSLFEMRAGIPYSLTLEFSKLGSLSDITLGYHREGNISRDDCLAVYERSIDWVANEYGPLTPGRADPAMRPEERTTPGGVVHRIDLTDDAFFVGTVSRELGHQRKVWPIATFIVVNDIPRCRVNVTFTDERLAQPPR